MTINRCCSIDATTRPPHARRNCESCSIAESCKTTINLPQDIFSFVIFIKKSHHENVPCIVVQIIWSGG